MKKLWLTVGLIAFLSGLLVIVLVVNPRGPREPEYHGRKLTRWLDDLDDHSPIKQTNAIVAIRQMGTNAVPFLVQMLRARDSRFRTRCIDLLERQHWIDFHFHYAYQKHSIAFLALAYLGPDAKAAIPDVAGSLKTGQDGLMAPLVLSRIGRPAVPALEDALTSSNVYARQGAIDGLARLADPSSIPNLLAALKDPNWLIRFSTAMALRRFSDQASVVVPALTNSLDDPDYRVQVEAARTLGSFGADARPAFRKLLQMVRSTNSQVSESAANALKDIDPEAGAKLNGK